MPSQLVVVVDVDVDVVVGCFLIDVCLLFVGWLFVCCLLVVCCLLRKPRLFVSCLLVVCWLLRKPRLFVCCLFVVCFCLLVVCCLLFKDGSASILFLQYDSGQNESHPTDSPYRLCHPRTAANSQTKDKEST